MSNEFLRQCLIVALEELREDKRFLAKLSGQLAALEDTLRTANPELAHAYAARATSYSKSTDPFEQDVILRRFDDLIQKLKGEHSL